MRSEFLPFSPPSVGSREIEAVVEVLRSGWLTTGPKTAEFEAAFAERLGAPGAVAFSSCTAALHVALAVHGIGNGHEVVTTTHTFAATANVIEHVGARPVFVDVDPDTLNMDVEQVRHAITDRTRAVIPVHFAGHPVDMEALLGVVANSPAVVIEDAAHALPASWKGNPIGSGDHLAAFSFYATKNLTTGEGGMLTGAPSLLERARPLGLHGMNRDAWKRYDKSGSWYYEVTVPGFKYNMTDVQASMGLVQLERLAGFHKRRKEIAARYNEALSRRVEFLLPVEKNGFQHAWHLYVLRLIPEALRIDRDEFLVQLKHRNIGSSVHFIPLHLHPYYRNKYGYEDNRFPISLKAYENSISLPLHPALSDGDVDDVIEAVLDIADKYGV